MVTATSKIHKLFNGPFLGIPTSSGGKIPLGNICITTWPWANQTQNSFYSEQNFTELIWNCVLYFIFLITMPHVSTYVTRLAKRGLILAQLQVSLFTIIQQIQQ